MAGGSIAWTPEELTGGDEARGLDPRLGDKDDDVDLPQGAPGESEGTVDPSQGGPGEVYKDVDPSQGGPGEGGKDVDPSQGNPCEGDKNVDPSQGGPCEGGKDVDPSQGSPGEGENAVNPSQGGPEEVVMLDETPASGDDGGKRAREESPDPSPKRSIVSLLDPLEDVIDNSGFIPTRAGTARFVELWIILLKGFVAKSLVLDVRTEFRRSGY